MHIHNRSDIMLPLNRHSEDTDIDDFRNYLQEFSSGSFEQGHLNICK